MNENEPVIAEDTSSEVDDSQAIPMATLTVIRGGQETSDTFTFAAPATVGRFDPAVGPIDIDLGTIPEGSYVSRNHAKITCEEGVWKIVDLGSSNGTFVLRDDFEKVDEAVLSDGMQVAFGNARFVFHTMSAAVVEDATVDAVPMSTPE